MSSIPNDLEDLQYNNLFPSSIQNPFKSMSQGQIPDSPPRESYSQRNDVWNPVRQINSSSSSQKSFQKLGGQFAKILGLDTRSNVLKEDYEHDIDEIRMSIREVKSMTHQNEEQIQVYNEFSKLFRNKIDRVYDRVADLEDSHDQMSNQQKELFSMIQQQSTILSSLTSINDERWNKLVEMQESSKTQMSELFHSLEEKIMSNRVQTTEPEKIILYAKEIQTKLERPSTPEKSIHLKTPKRSKKEKIIYENQITNENSNFVLPLNWGTHSKISKTLSPKTPESNVKIYSWIDDIEF